MLVLELPFVSQRLSGINHAPQEARTSQEIADAMARHGMSSATFIGHSLGTVYLAWLARLQPQLLASCVFIDPIGTRATRPPKPTPSSFRLTAIQVHSPCVPPLKTTRSHPCLSRVCAVFLLHHHKVAQSFLYSRPSATNFRGHVEHYFIKSEHSIVSFFHRGHLPTTPRISPDLPRTTPDLPPFHALRRPSLMVSYLFIIVLAAGHFYWFANILWAHDLHAPSAVIMADNDGIVPVAEVCAPSSLAKLPTLTP